MTVEDVTTGESFPSRRAHVVMPGLVPGIPIPMALCLSTRDGRDRPGHDERV
ncbi:MAG TPA: hypothetical protein VK434_02180 [Microvirga sp.]|jgi:hypothetical protein|nr:hypothetical protein [Microvirga sp.]